MNNFAISCVLIGVLLLELCIGHKTPSIFYISQKQIKDIGGKVELDCSVQYSRQYNVVWSKTGRDHGEYIFLSTGSSLITKDSRFTLEFDAPSTTYSLHINDIQETDAGFYHCEVFLSVNKKITADVQLSVHRPPIISNNSTQYIVVSEGQTAQMECHASGYPTPTIIWSRENNTLLPTGGIEYYGNILKITSVHKEDRGTYYCVADNGISRGDRRNINLEVEFSPIITVPRPRLGQALQSDIQFECHIEAYPPPAMTWLKDDIILSNNKHYCISHLANVDKFTDSTLRIITIEKRLYGDYKCKAVNKLGQAEARLDLFETAIPVLPPVIGQAKANTTTIKCPSTVIVQDQDVATLKEGKVESQKIANNELETVRELETTRKENQNIIASLQIAIQGVENVKSDLTKLVIQHEEKIKKIETELERAWNGGVL